MNQPPHSYLLLALFFLLGVLLPIYGRVKRSNKHQLRIYNYGALGCKYQGIASWIIEIVKKGLGENEAGVDGLYAMVSKVFKAFLT